MEIDSEKRIILAHQSRLLQDLLQRSITKIERLKIVAETRDLENVASLVRETDPDWVIVALRKEDLSVELSELLPENEDLSLLAITDGGDQIRIQKVQVHEERHEQFSLHDLGEMLLDRINSREVQITP